MKLVNGIFQDLCQAIIKDGRPLEAALCMHHFIKPSPQLVLAELKKFQNADGGFGHGLEPDFLLPHSSPMATSVGLQLLIQLDQHPEALPMIKAAIEYLETSFLPEREGWFATPPTVNDYPHTPWWRYKEDQKMSEIDENWGNPTAELIGYLVRYQEYVSQLEVDELVGLAIEKLNNKTKYEFHEIYCYIRLHNLLPDSEAVKIRDTITRAIEQLLSHDPHQWENDYQPKPMDFIGESEYKFGISDELVELNLDYAVEKLVSNGLMLPSWGKDFYTNGLEESWTQWQGILTLQTLRFLDSYDRIEK